MKEGEGILQHQPRESFLGSGGAPRIAGIRSLRRKILVAFACLTTMVCVCGAIALVFFERIASSASNLSDVSTPLQIESMALQRTADRMRAVLSDKPAAPHTGEEQLVHLARLDEEGREHIERLRQLAGAAGFRAQLEGIEQLQQDFTVTLRQIVQARARIERGNAEISDIYARFHAAASAVESGLAEIMQRHEGLSSSDYRSFRAVDEVIHKLTEAHALASRTLAVANPFDMERVQIAAERFLSSLSSQVAALKPQMQRADDALSVGRLDAPLESMKAALLGNEGLITRKRDVMTGTAIYTARSKSLAGIEARYNDVLSGVVEAVRRANERAVARTANTISEGRVAVFALTGIAALLAISAAFFLMVSIAGPLERLARHLREMRKGDLTEISDRTLLSSGDELGALSRAFNVMIRELDDARRELISKSEEETSKQVERMHAALANMSQGLVMFDRDQRLIISNDRFAEIYGLDPARIKPGMTFRQVLEMRVPAGSYHGDPTTYSARLSTANRDALASNTVVELHNGRVVQILRRPLREGGWLATHEDITERRQFEAKIAHMAHHDVLTNLPNRTLFQEKLENALARTARGEMLAVVCLDIDHFKRVNDTLSHSIGDALLRAVTERLLGCARETDTVARLGSDEFAILRVGLESPHEAGALAQRIIDRMAAPFILDAHQVVVGASVGVALAPNDGNAPDDLLKKADLALYRAKSDGRGAYRFFEPDMDASMQARRKLELELRNAIAAGQFELHYQPLVNLDTGQISGFEALLRWLHPERGQVSPGEFIPLAEEIGLIIPIGEWAIYQACRDAAAWPSSVHVAVNLSPAQFKSHKLVETVTLALTNSGLPADRLELEITEAVLLHDRQATLATLRQIKDFGVKIAMDDFGTGYSSLTSLRSFAFDHIKIDRSLISDLGEGGDGLVIVRAIASLGASLGMATIAEGVETSEQLERLRQEGCTQVQGFYLGTPKTLAEIAPLLEDIRRAAAA